MDWERARAIYSDQADLLQKATALTPIQFRSPRPIAWEQDIEVSPPVQDDGGEYWGSEYWGGVGLRMFHSPRFAFFREARCAGDSRLVGPVDVAAYQVEGPVLPLDPERVGGYRGEVLRFVAVDLGVFSRSKPLIFRAHACDPGDVIAQVHHLEGYVVALPLTPWHHRSIG